MDRFSAVERALRVAAPHALPDVVAAALHDLYGAGAVELRMADYGLHTLQTVSAAPGGGGSVPVNGTPQGRAFGAQEPYVVEEPRGGTTVHLPVTARGERLGVLTVAMPEERGTAAALPEMRTICEALAHEILVAERDTDLYLQARRATRLTLAAEMQWQLLPGHSCEREEFALGGHLEPAYAIFGDNFDWSASAEHLTLTVTNGMGEGIEAALLTNLAVNALRNARRAGLSLEDQAVLADQAVYARYRGEAFVSTLLMRFALATGEVEVVEAGSPRIWRMRGGTVTPLHLDAQLPLGMFEDTPYTAERFHVEPGDRLLFASDGVYDARSPVGEYYAERALARSLARNRLLPAAQLPGAVLRELSSYRGEVPLDDDALVVCLDWKVRDGAVTGGGQRPRS